MQKLIFYIFIFFTVAVKGQQFESNRLSDLFELLPASCKQQVQNRIEIVESCNPFGLPVPVYAQQNSKGSIVHIGYKLFDAQQYFTYNSENLRFLERILLELTLWDDDTLLQNRLIADQVTCEINQSALNSNKQLINFLKHDFTFKLTHSGLFSRATFTNSKGEQLLLHYKLNRQIISSKDKVEYGKEVAYKLKSNLKYEANITKTNLPNIQSLQHVKDSVYVLIGDSIFIRDMNQSLYYTLNRKGEVQPLIDRKCHTESLSNILHYPIWLSKDISIEVEHRIYGNEIVENYRVSLNNFKSYFDNEFQTYIGREDKVEIYAYCTMLLKHKQLNFVNLLYVESDERNLFSAQPKLKAKFYTGIPIDNLKNLYGKF